MAKSLHIVNPFSNPFGGSELHALHLYKILGDQVETLLWSYGRPHEDLAADFPIHKIDAQAGRYPRDGTIVIMGVYFPIHRIFPLIRPHRLIIHYNTPSLSRVKRVLRLARRNLGIEPEITYVSEASAEEVGLPGPIEYSPIDLQRFRPRRRDQKTQRRNSFAIGRLSRDVPEKHHREDIALYRKAVDLGMEVRLMGATCIYAALSSKQRHRMEILPCGAEAPEDFLASLDCFYYRTSDAWREPFGRVVVEAMATGVPVVCERSVGAARQITHGKDGFVIDHSAEALAIIRRLRDDTALAKRIGSAARDTVEAFFSEGYKRNLVAFYTR